LKKKSTKVKEIFAYEKQTLNLENFPAHKNLLSLFSFITVKTTEHNRRKNEKKREKGWSREREPAFGIA
jgi:hypothetical protein